MVSELMRRRVLMADSLPYDAEIEYLRATGTQYIDTGIYGNADTKMEASFNCSQSSNLMGSRTDSVTCITFYVATLAAYQRFGNKYATRNISLNADHILSINKTSCSLDGSTVGVNYSGTFTTPTTIFVMGIGGQSSGFIGEIYSAKIWNNDELVRDFIPVRVGTTGYMYDKVSKQLFGNAGTGSFILGNDK